jgi:hypothetical protein
MKTSGNFNYYLDNEIKTIEEIMHLVTSDMTVSIRGLDVLYFSPKYETNKKLDKATKQIELDKLCQRFSEIKLKNYEKENIKKEVSDKLFSWKPINNSIKVHEKDELSDVDKKYFKVMKESKKVELEMWKKFKQEALEQLGIKDIGFLGFSPKKENKTENMNRLVEEELERQEQQIFKDCNSSGTGEVFKNTEFINSTDGVLNPSGTTFGLDITKPYPFFENEDLAQETAEQIKQAVKGKNDKPQLSWEFIEEMAKRMVNNKSNGIITKEVLEEFKNTNFAFKLYEVLAGKQVNNTVIGKKENNDKPQLSILFTQFPKALEAITKCSEYGHLKYKETDTDYLNYQRVEGGSKAYADAGLRHRLYKKGTTDIESQLPHYYHVAWNALAELELLIKENSK